MALPALHLRQQTRDGVCGPPDREELMGHRTIQMTVRYAHLAPKHRLDAVQKLCDTGIVQNPPTDTGRGKY